MLHDIRTWIADKRVLRRWSGEIPPPAGAKRHIIKTYSSFAPVFIETGTYLGDTAAAARWWFDSVHTIEVDPTLAERARKRFHWSRTITVHEGDSSELLPHILANLRRPAMLWLDAHSSGGITASGPSPIRAELTAALSHPRVVVVLIDDARLFGIADWPPLNYVRETATIHGWSFTVKDDVVRLHR